MAQVRSWAGLDVHARSVLAVMVDGMSGEMRTRRLPGATSEVVAFCAALPGPTRVAYEAGPTGYGLARALHGAGVGCVVAAPGKIERPAQDRVKTDQRDAEPVLRLLMIDGLHAVRVPSSEEEALRDLVRAREDLRGDLMRARHRLSKLLLRHGLRYPGPGRNWTVAHHRWLESLRFEDLAAQASFVDYLVAVDGLAQRRGVLDRTIGELAPESPFAEQIARLRCFRGIDTLSAAGICAEVGDFARFRKPKLLAGHLGITPSERTSDEKRRLGGITKAGSKHARRLLVEAAHHYARPPKLSSELRRRQDGQDPRVCEISWRAQERLHARWVHLRRRRGKPAGKVAVACARELACFLWEAATID